MKYRPLGTTGVLVSEICFGAMTFGTDAWKLGGLGRSDADRLVSRALEGGVNFFDTADVYSAGEAETLLGQALGARRKEVILATKVRGRTGPGPNQAGLSRAHILAGVEASLRRLDTEWIDLYQIHSWDPFPPLEETLSTLNDLVRRGKVRYVGYSNLAAWQAATARGISRERGFERFATAQMYYSLVGRDIEDEVVPFCEDAGVGILAWSPLCGGFLSGKYRRDEENPPEGSRWATTGSDFPPFDRELGWRTVDLLREIAGLRGATPARVALAWVLGRPAVTSVIVGARKLAQLEDDLGASGLALEPEDLRRLDELTRPALRYPRWMIQDRERRRSGEKP